MQRVLKPVNEGESFPAFNLVTRNHSARCSVNGTSKSDSDPLDVELIHQTRSSTADLLQDPFGTLAGVHLVAFERRKVRAVSISDAELQFGSTDFDAQKHGFVLICVRVQVA